jgi:FixJ family two-component response regulator
LAGWRSGARVELVMSMNPSGLFLVVEDEVNTAHALVRLLKRHRAAEAAFNVHQARQAFMKRSDWTGLVVDIGLPDGSGLEVISFARDRQPLLPVLVLTGRNDPEVINRSHQLRAEFVCKPPSDEDLLAFVRRAIAFERVPDERLTSVVEELSRRSDLTIRETEVVVAALSNTRAQLTELLGVTENTLKSLVRSILGKTDHVSMDALTKSLLRVALQGSSDRSSALVDEGRQGN